MSNLIFGKGKSIVELLPKMANRHGLIAGATGSGKTVSLQVLAEKFSDIGVPVFMADIKGDLSGLGVAGEVNDAIQERIDYIGLSNFETKNYPVEFWDVFAKKGLPVRTTISEMGPVLLSRLMDLNETQSGILTIAFRVADSMGTMILDIKDLRSVLNYVSDNSKELRRDYGNISSQSVGAIIRRLLVLEDAGGDLFFGEPALNIQDLIVRDRGGKGIINILAADELYNNPALYSTFMLWLLSEIYEELEEVGDMEKPKMVFFFDEAHLLFNDAPKALLEKVEQVVRLIRSKGVGIFFVTQNPMDVPDSISNQLGNRIQHVLRAFTPKEQKVVKAVAQTFRINPEIDIENAITNLKTGEALVSFLDEDGAPSVVEKVLVSPPNSKIGPMDDAKRDELISYSYFKGKYSEMIDRESAYEVLNKRAEELASKKIEEEKANLEEKERIAREKEEAKLKRAKSRRMSPMERVTGNFMSSFSRQIASSIARGLMGTFKKRK